METELSSSRRTSTRLRTRNMPGSRAYVTPAKLNVRLKVMGRRPDGYHELMSIMVPVGLYDRIHLKVTSQKGIKISCSGLSAPADETNLACRAAEAFFANAGIDQGVSIGLTKNIPVAAGLGGGSSDAACVLKALNQTYSSPLSARELAEAALGLGADVPFFLTGRPCIAAGVGELLQPIEDWPEFWYIIIAPPIQVSTSWVYGRLDAPLWNGSSELELTNEAYQYIIIHLKKRPFVIGPMLDNDLERITAARFPVIGRIKRVLIEAGAEGALMSGSGPSVFGVFRSKDKALQAKEALATRNPGEVFLAQGLAGPPGFDI